ncbi:hypothetical protein WN943_024512 [Citrus x changshan-huyou]
MSNNSLPGEIPDSIGSLLSVRFLIFCNNHISGEVPPSLKNCSMMESLDLGDNQLSGNIPAWIGESMPSLSILRLRSNYFNGAIPPELCKLSALHILDLSHNNLSGFIPSCVGNFSRMKIEPPHSVEYEGSLQVNHLVGKIPTQIGKLEWLESLDLSKNKLSGSIPPSMVSLTFMNHLNLSYNNLSGEIPKVNQFQSLKDPSIYAGNLALCGDPLPKRCSEIDGTSWVPDGDKHEEDANEHDKLWLSLSVALGFIVGFWGVCGTLIIKKSWRYTYFQFVDK